MFFKKETRDDMDGANLLIQSIAKNDPVMKNAEFSTTQTLYEKDIKGLTKAIKTNTCLETLKIKDIICKKEILIELLVAILENKSLTEVGLVQFADDDYNIIKLLQQVAEHVKQNSEQKAIPSQSHC
jgi:hypothetical protein